MLPASDVQQTKIEELATKRKILFGQFQSKPQRLHLAVEIKLLDDQIAECNRQLHTDRRKQK